MEEEEDGTSGVDVNVTRFIRHFLLDRIIEKHDVLTLYRTIFRDEGNFQDVLDSINNLLQKNKLRIQLTTCEVTSKEYYVLFSTFYEPDMIWPNGVYTDNQLDYFQNILKQIIVSDNGTVSSIECLNITKKLSKSDAQDFLIALKEQKFLLQLPQGKFTVSPLTISELFPFFEHHFEEALVKCEICKKPVIYSASCANCGVRVHKYCLNKYKAQMKKPKCIKCNAAWNEENMEVD